jgi:hypothetical protein
MIFLGEVFFSEVILVSSFVAPFIYLVLGYVYILKVMVWSIAATFGSWNWNLRKGCS